jgi:glutamyl-tRNA reductase
MNFVGYQLELTAPHAREAAVNGLRNSAQSPQLVLDTCQRLECFGLGLPAHEHLRVIRSFDSVAAFERLARIAAGLESRILGELEVIGQVRTAYKQFHETTGRSLTALDRIFQDALALAREARRESEIDRNLTSLSGLAAHALMDRLPPEAPLAVVGSGSLATGVVRSLTKSGKRPVRIASRCPENALSLAMEVDGFAHGLDELTHLFDGARRHHHRHGGPARPGLPPAPGHRAAPAGHRGSGGASGLLSRGAGDGRGDLYFAGRHRSQGPAQFGGPPRAR